MRKPFTVLLVTVVVVSAMIAAFAFMRGNDGIFSFTEPQPIVIPEEDVEIDVELLRGVGSVGLEWWEESSACESLLASPNPAHLHLEASSRKSAVEALEVRVVRTIDVPKEALVACGNDHINVDPRPRASAPVARVSVEVPKTSGRIPLGLAPGQSKEVEVDVHFGMRHPRGRLLVVWYLIDPATKVPLDTSPGIYYTVL
jgi:hypothetical protein